MKTFPRATALPKAAALATAATLALAGCATGGRETGQESTTSSAAAASDNPWDLPLEQRPPLFDPCAEIPPDALSEAGYGANERDESLTRYQPGNLMGCGWSNGETLLIVVNSWMDKQQYMDDPMSIHAGEYQAHGRVGEKFFDKPDNGEDTVRVTYFTTEGAISVGVTSVTTLGEFRGRKAVDVQEMFESVSGPIIETIPEGDFR